MPLDFYLNALAGGLLTGAVYAMMAIGLSIIFGVIRVVNFAHGELFVLGMYGAFSLNVAFGIEPLTAIPIVAAGLFALGYALQRGMINAFVTRPDYQQFLLLVGLGLVLTNLQLIIYGPGARSIQVPYGFDAYQIGPLLLDKVRVYSAGMAAILVGLLYAFFAFTRTGKAIRACADNYLGAQIVGLNVRRLYAITFGLGTACAGAAGCLMILMISVHPHLAPDFTLLAFIIVIVGGLGSMAGALLGGILIGVSEALAGVLFTPSLKASFSFGLLILVLLLRPSGLLGRRA